MPFGLSAVRLLQRLPPDEVTAARRLSGGEVRPPSATTAGLAELSRRLGGASRGPVDVLVPFGAWRPADERVRAHVCSRLANLPGGSFLRLPGGMLVPSPELAYVQSMRQLDFAHRVLLGLILCGTYRVARGIARYEVPQLVSEGRLRSHLDRCPPIDGVGLARDALAWVRDGSASPRESILCMLASMPTCRGGFGLGLPELNGRITLSGPAARVARRRWVRCDLLWRRDGVALEYDSDEFHSARRADDVDRSQALGMMGIRVVTVMTSQFDSFERLSGCMLVLGRALGRRMRRAPDRVVRARRELYLRLRRSNVFFG